MAALSLSELNALRQSAAVILARQAALRTIKSKIKREGRVKLGTLSQATLTRLANEWLQAHPELVAEAAASPIVAELIKREGQLS
jgi:RecB family exonuclease